MISISYYIQFYKSANKSAYKSAYKSAMKTIYRRTGLEILGGRPESARLALKARKFLGGSEHAPLENRL